MDLAAAKAFIKYTIIENAELARSFENDMTWHMRDSLSSTIEQVFIANAF